MLGHVARQSVPGPDREMLGDCAMGKATTAMCLKARMYSAADRFECSIPHGAPGGCTGLRHGTGERGRIDLSWPGADEH